MDLLLTGARLSTLQTTVAACGDGLAEPVELNIPHSCDSNGNASLKQANMPACKSSIYHLELDMETLSTLKKSIS